MTIDDLMYQPEIFRIKSFWNNSNVGINSWQKLATKNSIFAYPSQLHFIELKTRLNHHLKDSLVFSKLILIVVNNLFFVCFFGVVAAQEALWYAVEKNE